MHANVLPPPARFNFARHLIDLNAVRSAKTALTDDLGSLRYGELAEQVQRMAAGLQSLGLRREDRVFLLMHDSCDWVVAFSAPCVRRRRASGTQYLLTAEDYAFMLDHSRAQAALVSGALLPTLQAAMSQGPHELKAAVDFPPCRAAARRRGGFRGSGQRPPATCKTRRHPGRRGGFLALFLRLHRQAQGHGPHPRQPVLDRRAVRPQCAGPARVRRGVFLRPSYSLPMGWAMR